MKNILVLFLFSSVYSFGQRTLKNDTLTLADGSKFYKSQSIELGLGSKTDGGFASLMTEPKVSMLGTIPPVFLASAWKGDTMKIVGFKKLENKELGDTYYLILASPRSGKSKFWCDPELGLRLQEIKN